MSSSKKKTVSQKYRVEYSQMFPVIQSSKLGDHHAFCKCCSSDFSISHGGLNDIEKHMRTKKHQTNSEATRGRSLHSYFTTDSDVSVINAEVLMTEFIVEHSLPLTVADHCGKLFRRMFPDSGIAKKYASGRTKTSYIAETLGKDTMNKIVEIIRVSPFSLATDGSTDYDDIKLYPICVRYFDPDEGRVLSVLLSLVECNRPSTGENIFKLLEAELEKHEIPWENLVSFSADNASVMLGKFKGVAAFLLKRAPSVYISGCPCHLMHIAAEKGAKQLPVIIEDLLTDIYYYLEKSSKRKQEFKSFQEKANLPLHKIIKHVSTRWLSLGQCIIRLLEQWDALLPFFQGERSKANGKKRQRKTQGEEQRRKKQKSGPTRATPSSATSTKKGASVPPAKRKQCVISPGNSAGPSKMK